LDCNSFNVGLSCLKSLVYASFFFSYFGFAEILTGALLAVTVIASLDEPFEPLSVFLNSFFSPMALEEDDFVLFRALIVISISWARVANSWKLLGLIPFKMYRRSQFIPLMHISTAEVSLRRSLHSKLSARHRLMYSTTASPSH
ncbi:hypothetical protein KSS87_009101, partial [Heliosperma pusillum]